jgi:hypothetical protein
MCSAQSPRHPGGILGEVTLGRMLKVAQRHRQGVVVVPFTAGSQGADESKRTSVGRIKFTIVLQLPAPAHAGATGVKLG